MYEKGALKEIIINHSSSTSVIPRKLSSQRSISKIVPSISSQSFKFVDFKYENPNSFYSAPIEYWSTLLNHAIGYGSLWRFPYYFILCGGAAFFIPFLFFFLIVGIPLLTMESALGQIFKTNQEEIFTKVKTRLFGLSLVSTISTFLINVYITVITSYSMFFFFNSFQRVLPWKYNESISYDNDSHRFFLETIVSIYKTSDNQTTFTLGKVNHHLLICLALAWILTLLLNFSNVKINSRLFYITSILPMVVLLILLITTFQIPDGFRKGFASFLLPQWSALFDYRIWLKSWNQAIFVLSLGFGGNILFSSKKNENEDVYKRSIFIAFTQLIFGIVCIFITSIYCGFISNNMNIDILSTTMNSPLNEAAIPFIIYPLALGMSSHCHLWSLLFFFMMVIIALQSQMIFYENLSVFISQTICAKYLSLKQGAVLLCIFGFVCGIPFITEEGFYLVKWMDTYATMVPLYLIILIESITVMKSIGTVTIREIIANKTGMVIPGYVFISSGLISPLCMVGLMVLSFIYHLCNLPENNVLLILQWGLMVFPFILVFLFVVKGGSIDKERSVNGNESEFMVSEGKGSGIYTEMQKIE